MIKVHGPPQGAKALFNELVSGRLAALLGVSAPSASTIELSDDVLRTLSARGFEVESRWAVGTQFFSDLTPASFPTRPDDPDFKSRNREYIHSIIPSATARNELYGRAVFENWVLMRDCKYDTLQVDKQNCPLFLDASYAFGGPEWHAEILSYDIVSIDLHSPYLVGVLDEQSRYEPWLRKLETFSNDTLDQCLADLPEAWCVPPEYIGAVRQLLKQTTPVFIPSFRDWLRWEYAYRSGPP